MRPRVAPARLAVGLLLATIAAPASAVDCRGLSFVDVTAAAALDARHVPGGTGEMHLPESMGAGVAWLDYDGDGWLDLYFVQSGPFPPRPDSPLGNRLFRNRGDGRFEEVTGPSGAGDRGYGQGVLTLDYDGDGALDLYLANYGPDVVLRNRGDGGFEDATAAVGVDIDGWSVAAAAADYDGDGWLDLYVARYVVYDPAAPLYCGDPQLGERRYCDPSLFTGERDVLLRNRGGRRLVDAGEAAKAVSRGRGLGVVFVDLDDDGHADLYVANDLDPNALFHNRGDGGFDDLSLASGAAVSRDGQAQAGMGLAAADFTGDGRLDLAVTNFDVETNTLYRGLGEMLFEDVSAASGFGPPSFNLLGFGIVAADFDRDGRLDVYVANGHIFERPFRDSVEFAQPDLLLLRDGAGRFTRAECGAAFAARHVGRGLAGGDFDNDGAFDLAVSNNGGPLQLLATRGVAGDWIGVRLVGSGGNREAIGARVELVSAAGRQSRVVVAGDSYASSSERRQLFAAPVAGDAALELRWPSGRRQRLLSPGAGRYLTLFEPAPR